MEQIRDLKKNRWLIERCIEVNGKSPEHNFDYYMYIEDTGVSNVFCSFGNDEGLLAQWLPGFKEWFIIGEPISGEHRAHELIVEAAGQLLDDSSKLVVETSPELRKKLLRQKITVGKPRFSLFWPVFDFNSWSGYGLNGGDWKKVRNVRNQFYKVNKVELVDSVRVEKSLLHFLIDDWVSRRSQTDADRFKNNKVYSERYHKMVDRGFEGFTLAKTLIVNGVPSSITAGWPIPNSKGYYSAVGIYKYGIEGLGEVANYEDLVMQKDQGYDFVDFGGSPESLLYFKQKFKPTRIYKSMTYSIKSG